MEISDFSENCLYYIEPDTKEKGKRLYFKRREEIKIENHELDEITINIPSENSNKSYTVIVRMDDEFDDEFDEFDDDFDEDAGFEEDFEEFICNCPLLKMNLNVNIVPPLPTI